MLYKDMTEAAVAESIIRLRDELRKKELADVAMIRRLIDNTQPAIIPPTMKYDLSIEYIQEFTPLPIARVIINKLQSAMYGRGVEHTIEGQEKNVEVNALLETWTRSAPGLYNHALSQGYCAIRFYPDWRRGVTWGVYDPDEVTPIFDCETEDLDPTGLIYHYRIPASSFDYVPVKQTTREVNILEHVTRHKHDRLTGAIIEPGQRRRWFSVGSKWTPWPYFEGDMGLNPYGDHIGAVLWRNDDSLDGPWGMSDILPVSKLLVAINHTNTDLKLLLKWNLWPVMYSNADISNLKYSWRQTVSDLNDTGGNPGRIDTLDWNPASLTAGMDFMRLLLQEMNETSSVPAIAMGDLTGIGNLSSGRALEVVMLPLTDLTLRRQKLQEWQEEMAIREMLAVRAHGQSERSKAKDELGLMTVNDNGEAYPYAFDLSVSVSFGQLGLANSTEDTVAYYTGLYAAGLISLEECIRGLHPEWNEKQVMEEIDRIRSETESRETSVVDEGRTARIQAMIDGDGQDRAISVEPNILKLPTRTEPVAMSSDTSIQSTALNGAQVSALVSIASSCAEKQLPIETAMAIATASFPAVSEEVIRKIFSPLRTFKPQSEPTTTRKGGE